MSDVHRKQINDRLDRIETVRDLHDRMDNAPELYYEDSRVLNRLKKASKNIESNNFDHYLDEALGIIAATATTADRSEIADEARTLLSDEDH